MESQMIESDVLQPADVKTTEKTVSEKISSQDDENNHLAHGVETSFVAENSAVTSCIEKQTENVQETEDTKYKLRNIDTQSIMKSELKQLIFNEVAGETEHKVLDRRIASTQKEIAILKKKFDEASGEDVELKKLLQIDNQQFSALANNLLRSDKVIPVMKKDVEGFNKKLKNPVIINALNKSEMQYNKMIELKKLSDTIKQIRDDGKKKIDEEMKKYEALKQLRDYKKQVLEDSKKKNSDLRVIWGKLQEKKEKTIAERERLKTKLESIKNLEIDCIDEEIDEEEEIKEKIKTEMTKLEEMKGKFKEYNEEIEEVKLSINSALVESTQLEEKLATKREDLKNVTATLEDKKLEYEDATKTLADIQQEHDEAIKNIDIEVSSNIQYIQDLQIKTTELEAKYNQECISKEKEIFTLQKQEKELNNLKTKFEESEAEERQNEETLAKFKDLEESNRSQLQTLNNKIVIIQKQNEDLKTKEELRYSCFKKENEQKALELKQQAEYEIATSNYLMEKIENLQPKADGLKTNIDELKEENDALKLKINDHHNHLMELRDKLLALKNNNLNESFQSSIFKSPLEVEGTSKKVHFNEVLSFKSMTESEESSQASAGKKLRLEK